MSGGLAPWQSRQVTAYIDANLSGRIILDNLAKSVRLSVCHFTRAFKESFGYSPHQFIMHKRVQREQGLMLSTEFSLGEIALECGLAVQAHFAKYS